MRNIIRYWELKEDAKNLKCGNGSLSHNHKEEIHVITQMDLLISRMYIFHHCSASLVTAICIIE
jgi:hypothetical protein